MDGGSQNLNIPEINSFINVIERDMEAVRNAIKYEYSNGLVEGYINKLKVIKRIMYGRCSFETLKTKFSARKNEVIQLTLERTNFRVALTIRLKTFADSVGAIKFEVVKCTRYSSWKTTKPSAIT